MGVCPYCGKKLEFLYCLEENNIRRYIVELWGNELHYEFDDEMEGDDYFICPYCGQKLCEREEEAVKFLR